MITSKNREQKFTATDIHVRGMRPPHGAHFEPSGVPDAQPSIHLGQDFEGNTGDPVFAIADGEVIESRTDVSGYGPQDTQGGALVALFTTSDGLQFKALYGHINNPHPVGSIKAGEVLGYINEYNPSQLHFGIHPGRDYPSDNNPWRGYRAESDYGKKWANLGWVDPIDFLKTHTPQNKQQYPMNVSEKREAASEASIVGKWTLFYDWGDAQDSLKKLAKKVHAGAIIQHQE
jgi:hypothetical protein